MDRLQFEDRNQYLRIYFQSADRFSNFHYFWLRHNCPCCIHPSTKEHILCPSKVPLDIKPQHICLIEADSFPAQIRLTWQDGHQSNFQLEWLAAHSYSSNEEIFQISAQDLSQIEVDYQTCAADLVSTCQAYLRKRGAIIVRDCSLDTNQLIAQLTQSAFRVRDSHFGYIEDLKTDNTTNKNTDQLGYTNAAVDLHTDQPFIENPPRFQILQCIQKADGGGENMLADAQQASTYLRALDDHAFKVLATTPVRFHRRQKEFESITDYPILTVAGDQFVQVRSSYFTIAPQNLAFSKMAQWYRAYQKFTEILENPAYQYRVSLNPQDFIFYDNFRMLHGRTSFSGPRWMKGIYFD